MIFNETCKMGLHCFDVLYRRSYSYEGGIAFQRHNHFSCPRLVFHAQVQYDLSGFLGNHSGVLPRLTIQPDLRLPAQLCKLVNMRESEHVTM